MAKAVKIESCFEALETIVDDLEEGSLPLDEALARYEAGLKQIRQARSILDGYAERLEALRDEDEGADEA